MRSAVGGDRPCQRAALAGDSGSEPHSAAEDQRERPRPESGAEISRERRDFRAEGREASRILDEHRNRLIGGTALPGEEARGRRLRRCTRGESPDRLGRKRDESIRGQRSDGCCHGVAKSAVVRAIATRSVMC